MTESPTVFLKRGYVPKEIPTTPPAHTLYHVVRLSTLEVGDSMFVVKPESLTMTQHVASLVRKAGQRRRRTEGAETFRVTRGIHENRDGAWITRET